MTSEGILFISHAAVLNLLSALEHGGDVEMWEVTLWHWENKNQWSGCERWKWAGQPGLCLTGRLNAHQRSSPPSSPTTAH